MSAFAPYPNAIDQYAAPLQVIQGFVLHDNAILILPVVLWA